MAAEDWKEFLGNSCTVCTIGMFLSGMEVCAKMYRNKTTGDTSPLSFFVGVVMTFVWFNYGLLKGDVSLTRVNGIGFILQSFYAFVFYMFAVNKTNVMKKMFIVSLLVGGLYWFINSQEDVTDTIGFLGATMSVLYCGAPLASIGHVFRTKSAEVLPFFLILMTVLVTGQWALYGAIISDPFVMVPNTMGFLIAAFQLFLFFYYPVRHSRPPPKSDVFIS